MSCCPGRVLIPCLVTFPPFSYNHITHLRLGQWPHKAYPLIWRSLGETPAWPRG